MGRHSRRDTNSKSRSHSRDSRRYRSRSRSYDRSRRRHHRRDDSRDRSTSYDRRSSRRDRHRSHRDRSDSRQSRDRSRSVSHSSSKDRRKDEKKQETKKVEDVKAPAPKTPAVTNSSEFLLPVKSSVGPKRVFRFDDRGREINEFGEVIDTPIIKPVATLSINKRQQQKSQINPYLSTFTPGKGVKAVPKIKNRFLVDSRIKTSNREVRGHKALNFIKEGSIVKFAEETRKKAARALVSQTTLAEVQPKPEGEEEKTNTPIHDPSALPPPNHNPVPEMEWWDYDFLPEAICQQVKEDKYNGDLNYSMCNYDNCITKDVIEHPVPVERNKLPPPKPLPLMLTKAERKKERRKNRAEREEEKRIRIQAGLLPKPEQKLTYRNYKQVLGTEALARPTWADNLVKEQIEKRKLAHQMRNEERKLTPEEAAEKRERKIIGDKNGDLEGCLFRIERLSDKKQRFKVNVNAQQYHLVGRCLIVPSCKCVMVYVEGTKKAMKHFIKLMTHRIQWNETVAPPNPEENDDTIPNGCTLLWQGMIKVCRFKEFLMKDCDSDLDARKEMEEKSLVQHWDSVINYVPAMSTL